jgi:hypothetical protein
MSPIEKYFVAAVLLVCGAIGLAMTLCGAIFSFGSGMSGVLVLSLPSLGLGLLMLNFTAKKLRKLFSQTAATHGAQDDEKTGPP